MMRFLAFLSAVAVVSLTLLIATEWKPFADFKCDPRALKKDMPRAEVIAVCGEPDSSNISEYPLYGKGPSEQAVYGRNLGGRNFNLYFEKGRLDAVQMFGVWP